ncbi:hypothetical protein P3W55_01965 [Pseudomonas citronellolis]|uniref:Uncharacterized protein n=1 Tax=Pseudomonas citronellolis TaxID=53408 RepID=A0AAW6P1A5_9PSED|nr:hypothetical protein [Pseudomonas citronellolis]MDF3840470.1 hypothetical protein [Pseudomonas citronellolis]WRT82957.1 hypothetical protein VK748_00530 [Pseudomonas citronellolis]
MATDLIGWAISLLSIFAAVVTALVKLLLWQFEKRLSERFTSQDEARKEASKHWEESFAKVLERQDKDALALQQLERAFLNFKADLPLEYVRREDWARGHSIIEAKLDGLALRYENILLKGARND